MKFNEIEEIKQSFSSFFSLEKIERLLDGMKNPLKNKWIVEELHKVHAKLQEKQKEEEYHTILEIIEDQIAFCRFAIQDSKCDPTKFVNFSS
ncbi:MAG: hypothetical protein ACOC44_07745 [Promethearchaeia archaeon]